MPAMYPDGEYDLAGFSVGAVLKAGKAGAGGVLPRLGEVRPGCVLLALALIGRCTCEVAPGGWHRTPQPLRRAFGGCGAIGFALAVALPLAFVVGLWGGGLLPQTRNLW